MVTTVTVPPERIVTGDLGAASGDLDLLLVSRAIVDGIGGFVRDTSRRELANWGAGPSARVLSDDDIAVARDAGIGIRGIFTVVPPADIELYRSFLRSPLAMPEQPEVGLAIVDFNRGNPVTRYQEGWISVKAAAPDGRDGWFVISMPVTTLATCYAGVAFGFPKYVADQMTVDETMAEARYAGDVRFRLDLTPGSVPDEDGLRSQGIFAVGDALTIHPEGGGCLLRWSQRQAATGAPGFRGAVLDWQPGTVTVQLRPDDPWSALVEPGTTSAGLYQRVLETGESYMVTEKLGPCA